MRRSTRLIAAAWLLSLGACAQEPPRSPSASSAGSSAGRVRSGVERGEERHVPAARGGSPSNEQLAQRYARTRALAVLHGSASYYSDSLSGRKTASGEAYQPRDYTAAHRTLAFGTVLRVTRNDGKASVYVRVTDRGPFGPRGRIVDLSRAAAEQLGMVRAGVVKVKVEVVEYGPQRLPRRRRR